jgi:hypothetical protein
MSNYVEPICLACGCELPGSLRWAASLRCHDCREANAPLRIEYARWERAHMLRRAMLDRDEPSAA